MQYKPPDNSEQFPVNNPNADPASHLINKRTTRQAVKAGYVDLILSTHWHYFLTTTTDYNRQPPLYTDAEYKMFSQGQIPDKVVSHHRRLIKALGMLGLQHSVFVIEPTLNEVPHGHAILQYDDIPAGQYPPDAHYWETDKEVSAVWQRISGFACLRSIQNPNAVAKYVSKYITKSKYEADNIIILDLPDLDAPQQLAL